MARNEEKSRSVLNRWNDMQNNAGKDQRTTRRPHLASMVDTLSEAERWRRDIVKEISRKVAEIQNSSLPQHEIRTLNDEINKLFATKWHWDRRIKELGGPDYTKVKAVPLYDDNGDPLVLVARGYKYFGQAKNLPGVREVFHREVKKDSERKRIELYRGVDTDYYGLRDEDDGVLVPLERQAEAVMLSQAVLEWEAAQAKRDAEIQDVMQQAGPRLVTGTKRKASEALSRPSDGPVIPKAGQIPSQQQVEQALLQQKKQQLLAKYATPALVQQQSQTKEMLNRK